MFSPVRGLSLSQADSSQGDLAMRPESAETDRRWFKAKAVYSSAAGIHLKFNSEAEAREFLLEGKRNGVTRNWRVGTTVTKPFPKTQPPAIVEGIEFQSNLLDESGVGG